MNLAQELQLTDEYRDLSARIDRLDPDGNPEVALVHRASRHIQTQGQRLGIFSGSFNPLTVAHVKMIEKSQKQFNLEEILLCLAKSNVDKRVFGFSLADRLFMLKRYALQQVGFSVAACSHGRFVDKIKAIKTIYPPRTSCVFITGFDTLIRLFDSKYYTNIHAELRLLFDQCGFITANRKEYNADAIRKFLSKPELRRYACNVKIIELSNAYSDVSSTAIRAHLQRGASINSLVPEIIYDLIETATVSAPDEI